MKTIKSTIGLAAVCVAAVAMAGGSNVASFGKSLPAKDSAGGVASMRAAPTEAERLDAAHYVMTCDAKKEKCTGDASVRPHGGNPRAADSSMALHKSMPAGGKIASNKQEGSESLEMPSFNECDSAMPKSLDFRVAGDSNNGAASKDMAMTATKDEPSVNKAPGALVK